MTKYWWCNQREGWQLERPRNLVCSSTNTPRPKYRTTVGECCRDDIIVHYVGPNIVAISRALSPGKYYDIHSLPDTVFEKRKHGYYFDAEYYDLAFPLHRNVFADPLSAHRELNPKDVYPIGPAGKILQQYFIPFDKGGLSVILKLMTNEALPKWVY